MERQIHDNIARGLWLLFFGGVLGLIGGLIPNLDGILSLVSLALELLGLHIAGRGEPGYRTAFWITLANVAVQFLAGLFSTLEEGALLAVFGLADLVLSFLSIYWVCATTARLLDPLNAPLAHRGTMVWKVSAVGLAVLAVCTLLSLIPLVNLLAGLLAIITAVVLVITLVVYLVFLYQASGVFRNW